jgi:hypothetical protein
LTSAPKHDKREKEDDNECNGLFHTVCEKFIDFFVVAKTMKDLNFVVRHFGPISIQNYMDQIVAETDAWSRDDYRQKVYAVHKDTNSIPLIWSANTWRPGDEVERMSYPELEKYQGLVDEIAGKFPGYTVSKAMFAKLPAGKSIPGHIDSIPILRHSRRFHVPIVTHEDVAFSVDGKVFHLETGHLYEINNCLFHTVENNSPCDRIHLIVDLLPDSYF